MAAKQSERISRSRTMSRLIAMFRKPAKIIIRPALANQSASRVNVLWNTGVIAVCTTPRVESSHALISCRILTPAPPSRPTPASVYFPAG